MLDSQAIGGAQDKPPATTHGKWSGTVAILAQVLTPPWLAPRGWLLGGVGLGLVSAILVQGFAAAAACPDRPWGDCRAVCAVVAAALCIPPALLVLTTVQLSGGFIYLRSIALWGGDPQRRPSQISARIGSGTGPLVC